MSADLSTQLEIPESLQRQLLAFRRRVRIIKLIEALAGAVIGILVGYLLTYALDRFWDTPRDVRLAIFIGSALCCLLVPLALERWVWRYRRLDQLAKLLSRKYPGVGDQLLGIIELADSAAEQARSLALVQAAIKQVAAAAERQDFRDAVPRPRHKRRAWTAGALATTAALLLLATAAAARSAWARFLTPWGDAPRYTFAAVQALPERLVVPHGEPFELDVKLAPGTQWRPGQAQAAFPHHEPVTAARSEEEYKFHLPGQLVPETLRLSVGDFAAWIPVEPMLRPELSTLKALVTLPEYLQRKEPLHRDLRGGALTAVKGSQAVVTAVISRAIAGATVAGGSQPVAGPQFSTPALVVDAPRELELAWRDEFGLTGAQPFKLTLTPAEDEAPSVICENLPRQQVLLDIETLKFQVRARDDFGVRRVGVEWKGLDPAFARPAQGEKILSAGSPDAEFLDLAAAFSPAALDIAPQRIAVRVFVEDYLPGRSRTYSPTCVFDVMDAEQHAIWIAAQLGRWQRMSLEVRDRELQLHEINKELRSLSAEELEKPETRRRIEAQAAAERANSRRLTALVGAGEQLLKQAMRNPEIGVGHLDKWAEMMQILKDIAGQRMPSVADLLKQSAASQSVAQQNPTARMPQAGQNRSASAGAGPGKKTSNPPSAVPSISDRESSQNPPKPGEPKPPQEGNPSRPRLTLPNTMLAGNGSSKNQNPPPASPKLEEAVRQQQDLLAEFEKIADELNTVLANLEGSTLVKRLKGLSRKQQQVAKKLGTLAAGGFGASERLKTAQAPTYKDLSTVEAKSAQDVSNIMDDMSAYFDRSRFMRFKAVLDDMRKQDVSAGLRNLGDDLSKENGLSISQAEYWSETLDRWAEDLVEASKCGACPGCKSKGSLPPSIVLEVLQILEGEVNLREGTRVAQQARPAVAAAEHAAAAGKLSRAQHGLRERIDKVVVRIEELPDAQADFGKELALLRKVSGVMVEAKDILASKETGAPAIAAETEAIELLLQSKRFNPNGGGGGGPNPGGGGGGTTRDTALALVGTGVNEKEVREDRGTSQATGTGGPGLPEEFRAGLDEYFNRLERQTP